VAHCGSKRGRRAYRAYGLSSPSLGTAGNTPGAQGTQGGIDAYGGFFTSPGYAFRRDEGLKAIDRGAAARGILHSGASVKAEQRYGEGLAASEYDSYTARLAQLAGLGAVGDGGNGGGRCECFEQHFERADRIRQCPGFELCQRRQSINAGLNNVMTAYLMRGQLGG
jgi:hypothetical protein